jgi:hypothetical protein
MSFGVGSHEIETIMGRILVDRAQNWLIVRFLLVAGQRAGERARSSRSKRVPRFWIGACYRRVSIVAVSGTGSWELLEPRTRFELVTLAFL